MWLLWSFGCSSGLAVRLHHVIRECFYLLRGYTFPEAGGELTERGDATASKVRFGEYVVDLQVGEIYKRGKRIKLAEQPATILALLIKNPGELVTREEMCARLWPEQTYVDFDRSLNSAVRALRRALSDSPKRPRFIETLPKRGYRFIAQVEAHAAPTSNGFAPAAELDQPDPSKRKWTLLLFGGITIALIGGSVAAFRSSGPAGPLQAQELVGALPPGLSHVWGAISPDGLHLARRDGDDGRLFVDDLESGESRLLVNAPVTRSVVWSPDGRRIAFVRETASEHTLEIVEAATGASRVLRQFPVPQAVTETKVPISWSRPGDHLVLANWRGDWLATFSVETLELNPVELDAQINFGDAVSGDGRFVADVDRGGAVRIVKMDGSGVAGEVVAFEEDAARPTWSPDGSALFFIRRFRNNYKAELWSTAIDPATGVPVGEPFMIVPMTAVRAAIRPVVTDEGDFIGAHQASPFRAQVVEVDPQSGETSGEVVMEFPRATHVEHWSTSGSTLFIRDRSLDWRLPDFVLFRRYNMETGTDDVFQVARIDDRARYTRDFGKASSFNRTAGEWTFNLVDVETRETTEVLRSEQRICCGGLSNNGDRVAYLESDMLGEQGTVMVADIDGSSVRRLYTGAKVEDPGWSPMTQNSLRWIGLA